MERRSTGDSMWTDCGMYYQFQSDTLQMDDTYFMYNAYVNHIVSTNDLSNFKSCCLYKEILEHVSPELGQKYMNLIYGTSIPIDLVKGYCELNDKIGSPDVHEYEIGCVSPTSLRYVYHSHLILAHFKEKADNTPIDIVEVGGGYGGLALAISHFANHYGVKINSYSIIDLPTISKLQELYLSNFKLLFSVEFHSSLLYGDDINHSNLYLISNYCFSELSDGLQGNYRETLFPKLQHGFLAWNYIPVYDFGKVCTVEDEVPSSAEGNKYVRF